MLCALFTFFIFFFNDTATTEIYTLSLHDALPICALVGVVLIEVAAVPAAAKIAATAFAHRVACDRLVNAQRPAASLTHQLRHRAPPPRSSPPRAFDAVARLPQPRAAMTH